MTAEHLIKRSAWAIDVEIDVFLPELITIEITGSIVVAPSEHEIGVENRLSSSVLNQSRLRDGIRPIAKQFLFGIAIDLRECAMSDRTSVISDVDSLIDRQLSEVEHIDEIPFLHWTSIDRFDANRFRYSLVPWIELGNVTERLCGR